MVYIEAADFHMGIKKTILLDLHTALRSSWCKVFSLVSWPLCGVCSIETRLNTFLCTSKMTLNVVLS